MTTPTPTHRLDALTTTFAADPISAVPYEALEAPARIVLQHGFGFQAVSYSVTVPTPPQRPRPPAEFLERMRRASERRKAQVATPDAGESMAGEFEAWAPLRREATSALLGDDE